MGRRKGKDCKYVCLLSLVDGGRRYRCCVKFDGFMLKHWRCVGKDHPDCPGFEKVERKKPKRKDS